MRTRILFASILLLSAASAQAATITPIGLGGFSGGETVEDYGLVQTFAPVDGDTFSGVLHNFSVGGASSLDAVIDSGPLNTNNILIANIEGDAAGILSLSFLSGSQTRLGFGWALSAGGTVDVELFDAADVSLGSIAFAGAPDPLFVGGFAGLESSLAFARADISFSSSPGGRFAFDKLRFESTAPALVPEPDAGLLFLVSLLVATPGLRKARA